MQRPTRSLVVQLGGAAQSKFLFDMRLVRFDCFHAQMQLTGEAGGTETAPNQRKN
jgi:hypothetical protein